MTTYGYLRVSTDKQDCDNQKLGVESLAKQKGLNIDSWITDDGVSGTKEPSERKLGKLLKKIKKDDVIICSELSRLGRKLFMIISILEHCMKIGAKVLTVKDGYELGDNVQSKVLAFAFGLVDELEREMISKRTKEALQRRKADGKPIGRQFGAVNKKHSFDKFDLKTFEKFYSECFTMEKTLKKMGISTSDYSTNASQEIKIAISNIRERIKKEKEEKRRIREKKTYYNKWREKLTNEDKLFDKKVVRLSDHKVFSCFLDAYFDSFPKKIVSSYELNRMLRNTKETNSFCGMYFEFFNYYNGKECSL